MKPAERWPYIAPYCRRMGSFDYYVAEQYEAARRLDAPRDTYAVSNVGGPPAGEGPSIYRVSDCDEYGRARHERDAGVSLAEVLK